MRAHIIFIILFLLSDYCLATESIDSVDRSAEDFVSVSLLVGAPGGALYSQAGHACLRLQCPTYRLDYCYSYESEDVNNRVLRFLQGDLKMGMTAVPFAKYLKQFRNEGRTIREYPLNLPPNVETRLWQIMDQRLIEGMDLPYDCLQRGCAQTAFQNISQALDTVSVCYAQWPERWNWTRREFAEHNIKSPWTKFVLYSIIGTEADRMVSDFDKIVIPEDLAWVWQHATINGKPIITAHPIVHTAVAKSEQHDIWDIVTPLRLAFVLLILAISQLWLRSTVIDWLLLAIETLGGIFFTYMLCISNITNLGFSWLIIPYNLLPFLFWRWRHLWALPWAVILLVWCAAMTVWPHQLTDWTHVVLTLALAINYTTLRKGRSKTNSLSNRAQQGV